MRSVVVVGSGVAGTAAAIAARKSNASVRVITGAAGATTLAGGALDFAEWSTSPKKRTLPPIADQAFSTLDFASLPDAGVLVATTSGILRPAAGADHALLDLDRTGRGAILVPRCDHPAWDGPSLARAWASSEIASARALTFVGLDVQLTRFREERLLGDIEIAARHDDPARLEWLAERLREVLARNPGFVGVILPAWLGVDRSRADDLSARVGVRCGEAMTGLASSSGARFERARDRAFASLAIEVTSAWAKSAESRGSGWTVSLEDEISFDADAVVIATGGLVGGGLAYAPAASESAAELPSAARPTMRSTLDCPVAIGESDAVARAPSTLFGTQPEAIAWPFSRDPWLDRAGALVGDDGAARGVSARGLYACGDVVADRPRGWLTALASGATCGAAAARA